MSRAVPPSTAGAGEAEGAAPLVGAQLRERRFASGMSLRELARRLDVSPSLVSQIETGKIQPSVRTLYAIVSELGLSLDEIFELVGTAEPQGAPAAPAAVPVPPPRPAIAGVVHRADDRRVIELESGCAGSACRRGRTSTSSSWSPSTASAAARARTGG